MVNQLKTPVSTGIPTGLIHSNPNSTTDEVVGLVMVVEGIELRLAKLNRFIDQETDVKQFGLAALVDTDTDLHSLVYSQQLDARLLSQAHVVAMGLQTAQGFLNAVRLIFDPEIEYNWRCIQCFKKQCSFAIRVWFGLTPPPVMVKDHKFTFFLDPSLTLFMSLVLLANEGIISEAIIWSQVRCSLIVLPRTFTLFWCTICFPLNSSLMLFFSAVFSEISNSWVFKQSWFDAEYSSTVFIALTMDWLRSWFLPLLISKYMSSTNVLALVSWHCLSWIGHVALCERLKVDLICMWCKIYMRVYYLELHSWVPLIVSLTLVLPLIHIAFSHANSLISAWLIDCQIQLCSSFFSKIDWSKSTSAVSSLSLSFSRCLLYKSTTNVWVDLPLIAPWCRRLISCSQFRWLIICDWRTLLMIFKIPGTILIGLQLLLDVGFPLFFYRYDFCNFELVWVTTSDYHLINQCQEEQLQFLSGSFDWLDWNEIIGGRSWWLHAFECLSKLMHRYLIEFEI